MFCCKKLIKIFLKQEREERKELPATYNDDYHHYFQTKNIFLTIFPGNFFGKILNILACLFRKKINTFHLEKEKSFFPFADFVVKILLFFSRKTKESIIDFGIFPRKEKKF